MLTVILAVVSGLLVPRVRINSDVTTYLPDDSPMRKGLTVVERHLPGLDIRRQIIRMEFPSEVPSDTLQSAIEALLDDPQLPDIRERDGAAYYQYSLPRDTDGARVKAAFRERFGARGRVEIEDNTGMPEGVPRMIAIGFTLIFLILIVMCPSFVEALLFMLTIGLAILINMGTNVVLPSVSMITNALSTVLQMALSLDYAIILSNRYRQAKEAAGVSGGAASFSAMAVAVGKAAPSILSSALTTIASLLMLCFMRLRFGMDLGVVLSKGVLCSLICTFTLLPALLLACDKAVSMTSKRVPLIPTDGIARFEHRFRIPLALAFLALFAGSYFLQRKVPVYYSMTRATDITRAWPPRNTLLLIYPTAEERALLPVLDSVGIEDTPAVQCLSYPTIALTPRTEGEWRALFPEMLQEVPPEAMGLLFYAASHPVRDERFALGELRMPPGVRNPLQSGLPLSGPDLSFQGSNVPPEDSGASPKDSSALPEGSGVPPEGSGASFQGSTTSFQGTGASFQGSGASFQGSSLESASLRYTYEGLHRRRTVVEMHQYLGGEVRALRIAYRMAGHGGKGDATMSALEVMDVVQKKILGNKVYAAMIPKARRVELAEMKRDFDATLAAGPEEDSRNESGNDGENASGNDGENESGNDGENASGNDSENQSVNVGKGESGNDGAVAPPESSGALPEGSSALPEGSGALPEGSGVSFQGLSLESTSLPADPAEDLAVLALSGKKCTASRCYRVLHKAGVKVTPEEVDLLYLYNGYLTAADTSQRLSLVEMLGCLDTLVANPLAASVIDSTRRVQLTVLRGQLDSQLGLLRSGEWSAAVIQGDWPEEGTETYAFIGELRERCEEAFAGETYLAGYSVMYDEMKDSFPRELLLVTLLTALVIFLIVAVTFRRPFIALILVAVVLTAVWLDVFLSGLGGRSVLFMAYFIVQSILMGATIDYSILLTHYYRESRRTQDVAGSLRDAYRGSIHTIMTSGLIMTLGTWVMTFVISDPVIVPVLRSIASGALIAILLILFVLPSLLSLLDRSISPRRPR